MKESVDVELKEIESDVGKSQDLFDLCDTFMGTLGDAAPAVISKVTDVGELREVQSEDLYIP